MTLGLIISIFGLIFLVVIANSSFFHMEGEEQPKPKKKPHQDEPFEIVDGIKVRTGPAKRSHTYGKMYSGSGDAA